MRRQTHIISSTVTTSHQCDHHHNHHLHHNSSDHVSVVSGVHSKRSDGQPERDDNYVDDGPMFIRPTQNFAVPFESRRCDDGAQAGWDCLRHQSGQNNRTAEAYPEYHYIATPQEELASGEYQDPTLRPANRDRIYENLRRGHVERQQNSSGYGRIGQPRQQSSVIVGQSSSKSTLLTTNSLTRGAHSHPRKPSTHRLIEDDGDQPWDYLLPGKTLSCTELLQSTENIYENICDQCCSVFTGSECRKCIAPPIKAVKSSDKVGSLFTGLFSSFRSKSGPQKARSRPTIVHNVGNVFRTNASFDLNEICRLKATTTTTTCQPIYSQPVSGYGCPNKHFIQTDCKHLPTQCVRSAINKTPPNHKHTHSSVSPQVCSVDLRSPSNTNNDVTKSRTNNSRSATAIVVWMTSLRWSTEEYDDDQTHHPTFSTKRIVANSSSVAYSNTVGLSSHSSSVAIVSPAASPKNLPPTSQTSIAPLVASSSNSTTIDWVTVREKIPNQDENDDNRNRRWAVTSFRENSVVVKRQAIYVRSTRDKTKSALLVESSYDRGKPVLLNDNIDSNQSAIHNPTKELAKDPTSVCSDLISFVDPIVQKVIPPHSNSHGIIAKKPQRNSKRDRLTHAILSICLNRSLIISADPNHIGRLLSQCNLQNGRNTLCVVDLAQRFHDELQNFVLANRKAIIVSRMSDKPSLVCDASETNAPNEDIMTNSVHRETHPKPKPRTRQVPPVVHRQQKPISAVTRPAPPIPAPRRGSNSTNQPQNTVDFIRVEKRSTPAANSHLSRRFARSIEECNQQPDSHVASGKPIEDTYQSIWQFRTVGQADDISPVIDDVDDVDDDDSDNNDDIPSPQSDIDSGSLSDGRASWELADEFQFSLVPSQSPPLPPPFDDPYRRICVLLGVESSKHNQLLFDLSQPLFRIASKADEAEEVRHLVRGVRESDECFEFVENYAPRSDQRKNDDAPDSNNNSATAAAASVNAWRTMLRRMDYADDEEDVVRKADSDCHLRHWQCAWSMTHWGISLLCYRFFF